MTETANGETTQYEYGLERIAAYTATDAESVKTQYVYDVRGSVIQTITGGVIAHISEITAAPQTQSYAYIPFGEQLGDKLSGYTYNAEYYDSATGMLNLRARQYEPAMMRFAQPDIVRGYAFNAQTLNRYSYSLNNPITYSDPSGMIIKQVLGGLAGAIAGAKSGAKTAYGASRKTGANTLQSIVTGVKGAIAGAKVGYKAGSSAGKKASSVRSAITKGKAVGSKAGTVAGLSVAVNQAQKRKGSMTPKQLSTLAQQQELLRKARNAKGAEYESILREIDRACSAYSGIAQAKDMPTEAVSVYAAMYYGFDAETARLLEKTRLGIKEYYSEIRSTQRDEDIDYALLIGRMVYGSDYGSSFVERFKWDGTAGSSLWYEHEFFKVIGLSEQEYKYLRYSVRLQHALVSSDETQYTFVTNENYKTYELFKPKMEEGFGRELTKAEFMTEWNKQISRYENQLLGDYAHYSITTGAILNDMRSFARWVAEIKTGGSEKRKRMAGWLGDATIRNKDRKVDFKNDDYVSDLDAENITAIMKSERLSLADATKLYSAMIKNNETRATIFLKYNDLESVKKQVLKGLKLSSMEELKAKQPDAHNFIRSLEEGLNTMGDFNDE